MTYTGIRIGAYLQYKFGPYWQLKIIKFVNHELKYKKDTHDPLHMQIVLYSMPAAGKLSVGDSVPAAAKLA